MQRFVFCLRTILLLLSPLTWSFVVAWGAGPLEFNRDIRPILADKCFACHGIDSKHRAAGLRLDTAEGAYGAGESGEIAIRPHKPQESELLKRITSTDSATAMPPPKSKKSITDDEKRILQQWIAQGAPYQKHWAFESPVAQPVPGDAQRNPIDAFIEQRLKLEGWSLSPRADKETLIRRVAFALTGLPPTIAEVDAFLSDSSPNAYASMVDRYLASPHFAEEMSRHWLDVARYADTHGLHLDNERQMWAYRDWVVAAFNRNLPFDQFTIEQIAGDLLPNPTQDQLVATGFNRCNVTTSEGGSINEEFVFRYAVDRTSTTIQAWMGLTAGCAVCHDHKYDPISQKEFYSLYAFFNSAADPAMDGNALLTQPVLKLETPEYKAKLAALDGRLTAKQKEIETLVAGLAYQDPVALTPPPAATDLETVWLEDAFPAGANPQGGPGHATNFVQADQGGLVFSGKKALRRSDAGLSQDFYEGGASPLPLPPQAKIFAYVYLDPNALPKSIMLQFHKGGWKHRVVWGDYNAIEWGAVNTYERVHLGELPEAGKWVRLEFPVEKVGLNPGEQITGFACTQFGGTVHWDKLGVVGRADPASDPQRSLNAWWKAAAAKEPANLPNDLKPLAKRGPGHKDTKPEEEKKLRDYYLQNVCVESKPKFEGLASDLAKLQAERTALEQSVPSTFIYKDMAAPRPSFVMQRGAYDKPGDKVEPSVPVIFPPLKLADANARPTRLDLAKWLVDKEHPLTARVAVNRLWQQFFGMGLVKTSEDFGSQGHMPSHPELLDFLAVRFRDQGWNMKEFIRLMLTSETFQQSTRVSAEMLARDPDNRLYARGPRFRLDAEQIRDNALFVSGLMKLEIGGKGVKPYQPANNWEPVGFGGSNTRFYKQDSGDALYRRSIYTFFKRTAPHPFMTNFDAPNREQFCARRDRSDTPLQALQLMNDVQHVEAARAFAERLLISGGSTAEERITTAYRTIIARRPDAEELKLVQAQLTAHLARYEADVEAAKKLISVGESKPRTQTPPAPLAAYTLMVNMLLNLDETLNRN